MLILTAITIILLVLYGYLGLKRPGIALITSPIVTGVLIVIALAEEDITAACIAPFIFPVTLIAILFSRPESGVQQWPRTCARWILIVFFFLLTLVIAAIVLGPLGFFGIALFVLFIASIIAFVVTSRHTIAAYVISTIGASMRQNLPLPMALQSAAGGFSDRRSRILSGISKWLIQGYSLSESIKRGYPKCPGYAIGMITAAERIGQLPFAIQAIETDMVAKADERRKIRPVHPIYPVLLMLCAFLILLNLMVFVIPQYESALREIVEGTQLPAATRWLLDIASVVAFKYGWLLWLILVLNAFVAFPVSIYVRFRPRRPEKPFLFSRIGDFIKWHLPILHRFEKDYSMVQVTELLRLSLSAGCTVNDAIRNTLSLDVNNCFRKRLRKWLTRVERGENIAKAARASGLGSTLAWAFDDKVNQGNTISILETLESFYRSNYSYCVNLARFILWPCVILVMGATIGFIVFAIFSPLITIINQLTIHVYP